MLTILFMVALCQQVIDKIKEKLEISREDDGMFKYVGQEVKQTYGEITINQQQYTDDLSQLKYLSIRTSQMFWTVRKNVS